MPRVKLNWKTHKKRWENCDRCELACTRKKVVLLRGKVPCDVLFVGEAPGPSENSLGRPFVGPAGDLLDSMIEEAFSDVFPYRTAFTNVIACIPLEDGTKLVEPPKYAIEACRSRLKEVINLTSPSLIVGVGKVSQKETLKALGELKDRYKVLGIDHPAFLLRLDIAQRGLAIQRNVVELRDAAEDLIPF